MYYENVDGFFDLQVCKFDFCFVDILIHTVF